MLASIAEREQFRSLSAAKVRNVFELLCDWGVKSVKSGYTSQRNFYGLLKERPQHLLSHPLRNGHGFLF